MSNKAKKKEIKNEISSLVLHKRPIRTLSLFITYVTKTLGGLMAQAARNRIARFVGRDDVDSRQRRCISWHHKSLSA